MNGRVAIVTGTGQGLGRAFAKGLAAKGAKVVIAEINEAAGTAVADEITADGGDALAIATDVANSESVNNMVEQALCAFSGIDILVNNAALLSKLERKPMIELTDDDWGDALQVNATGAFYCARAVVPAMQKAQWGRIINLSSDTAIFPPIGATFAHYITSKAALIGLTRALARELGSDGITVNAVMPGATETEVNRSAARREHQMVHVVPLQSIPRVEVPEDLVGAVQFLASDDASFITGQCLPVNGGIAFI
ncbi:MAG: 3-oxoacyl-ACP reductase FabG [Proteobacteria bacterium]|nr:3-oxoacyl-ACP reductase FabG [Pseudomonadota bacterium]